MRTSLYLAAAALVGTSLPVAAAAPADPAFGRWKTDDGSAIVRVGPCAGGKLCGWIERVLDSAAPTRDVNNPDPAKRTRKLVGAPILYGYTGQAGKWTDGRAYDPKAGRAYNSRLATEGGNKLKVTGCIAMLCKSKLWTRVD